MGRRSSLLARAAPIRTAIAAALLVAGAACGGGDGGTGPTADVAGRYEIVQINDDVTSPFLAFEEVSEGFVLRLEVVSGTYELRPDGGYTSGGTVRVTFNGELSEQTAVPQNGRFRVSGSTVTFDPAGSDPEEPNYTATRDGDTLTFDQRTTDPATGETQSIRVIARR